MSKGKPPFSHAPMHSKLQKMRSMYFIGQPWKGNRVLQYSWTFLRAKLQKQPRVSQEPHQVSLTNAEPNTLYPLRCTGTKRKQNKYFSLKLKILWNRWQKVQSQNFACLPQWNGMSTEPTKFHQIILPITVKPIIVTSLTTSIWLWFSVLDPYPWIQIWVRGSSFLDGSGSTKFWIQMGIQWSDNFNGFLAKFWVIYFFKVVESAKWIKRSKFFANKFEFFLKFGQYSYVTLILQGGIVQFVLDFWIKVSNFEGL
jgi:hypothetical protein